VTLSCPLSLLPPIRDKSTDSERFTCVCLDPRGVLIAHSPWITKPGQALPPPGPWWRKQQRTLRSHPTSARSDTPRASQAQIRRTGLGDLQIGAACAGLDAVCRNGWWSPNTIGVALLWQPATCFRLRCPLRRLTASQEQFTADAPTTTAPLTILLAVVEPKAQQSADADRHKEPGSDAAVFTGRGNG